MLTTKNEVTAGAQVSSNHDIIDPPVQLEAPFKTSCYEDILSLDLNRHDLEEKLRRDVELVDVPHEVHQHTSHSKEYICLRPSCGYSRGLPKFDTCSDNQFNGMQVRVEYMMENAFRNHHGADSLVNGLNGYRGRLLIVY